MIRFLYNFLWPLGLLIFLPGYVAKMIRRGGYRTKFGQRLGIYDPEVRHRLSNEHPTWLHAVSVGEVNIALKLANALRALEPDLRCVLTTTTTTGFALASRTAPPWIEVMYTPLDYWPIMRRAVSVIRPARIVLVEAEVWPNLAAAAHALRIPLSLVNARLSPRSERRYRRFRFFVAPTFRLLDLVCVPERGDVERWTALGVSRKRIRVTGSIKFDPDVQAQSQSVATSLPDVLPGISLDSLVLFGGSTHRGEEEILVTIFLRLREQFPSLRLFIAPRHVERLQEIRTHLSTLPLRVTLATEALTGDDGGDAVRLTIRDTGAGMSEEVRTRMFEPFYTTKDVGRGTGLGLSIVYGIIEQSGGTIRVESAPGHGSSFHITLPRVDAPLVVPASVAEATAPRGDETVLVVEDDEDVRDFVQFVLARAGYRVLVAEDGVRALELAESRPQAIDLLLSDIVMPRLNGHELARHLVARRPRVKVMHMSGYPGIRGSDGSPDAPFLQKPFSPEELLRAVRNALDRD